MSNNNFIYKKCPLYIIWELINMVVQTRALIARYTYCILISKIAHACTFADDNNECTIELINTQSIDITGEEDVLSKEECKEFFNNIMEYSLPNFLYCDALGLNICLYGQLDSYIYKNIFPLVKDKYDKVFFSEDEEINTKKSLMIKKLFFKFSNSTKDLYLLTSKGATEKDLKLFEKMRVTPSGYQQTGDIYYIFDNIFTFYDFSKINWTELNNDTEDKDSAKQTYINGILSKTNGNFDISDIIDNFTTNLDSPEFIEKYCNKREPFGFFIKNSNKYIGDIIDEFNKIVSEGGEEHGKYKSMFFVNFYNFNITFLSQYMFDSEYNISEDMEQEYYNENEDLFNNNYREYNKKNENFTVLTSDNFLDVNKIDTLAKQMDRITSLKSRKSLTSKNLYNRFMKVVDSKLEIDSYFTNNVPKDSYLYTQAIKNNDIRTKKALEFFGLNKAINLRPSLSGAKQIVGKVAAFAVNEIKFFSFDAWAKPLVDALYGGKGATFPVKTKPAQGGVVKKVAQKFNNGGRRIANVLAAPFVTVKKVGAKLSASAGKYLGAAMIAVIAIGIKALTERMWDDYCEMAGHVVQSQLYAKSQARLLKILVFGGEGPECDPDDNIEKMLKNSDNGINKTLIKEHLPHLIKDENEDEFKCLEVKECKKGGALAGTCNCNMFREFQVQKDSQIKNLMIENMVFEQKKELIKHRNNQFTIVLFTISALVIISLLIKFILSPKHF